MRRYEIIFIVKANCGDEEINSVIDKVDAIIEADGGTVIKTDKWGLRKLAYLIKKESQGHYVYMDFGSIPASVDEIERILRIDDRVLKYMTVKLADSCDPVALKEEAENKAAQTPSAPEATDVEEDEPVADDETDDEDDE